MELNNQQEAILHGTLLGDGYLQQTSEDAARLRIEHSLKQEALVYWKYAQLEHIFQSEPQLVERTHPATKKTYQYLRLQSYAFTELGALRQEFYNQAGKKIVPNKLDSMLSNPLTIATWYMDDGYYDKRDKSAHIYLQAFVSEDITRLIAAFEQHNITPKAYCRPDRAACQLNFRSVERDNLFALIKPHVIEEMRYKISLDPVTTDLERVR